MKNNFFTLLAGSIILGTLTLALSSCEDDYEPTYYSYGIVNTLSGDGIDFCIALDNGSLAYPKETSVDLSELSDSTRLFMYYNILSEQDSSANIRIVSANRILTKPILTYDESILDSMGNDPINITNAWFAHGFLNLEFEYYGRYKLSSKYKHMVNLLQHPSTDGKWVFEFRHNDFGDHKEQIYKSAVSFPIAKILEGAEKPVTITLKHKISSTSDCLDKIIYK